MGYSYHPMFTCPSATDRIWRYIDFSKFVDLVRERALFFARADRMSDPQEGVASPFVESTQLNEIVSKLPPGAVPPCAIEFRAFIRSLPPRMYLSCWHLAQCESPAMWDQYANGRDGGVAIQSTFGRLERALPHEWDHAIHAGMVRYIDNQTEAFPTGNAFDRYLHKPECFADECELRVMFDSQSDSQVPGFHVPVDLPVLVERVYISPIAPESFGLDVERTVSESRLRLPVMRSQLPASEASRP
jgi:hypothetical protein